MAKLIYDFFIEFMSGWEYAYKDELANLITIAFVIITFYLIFKLIFWVFKWFSALLGGGKYFD